MSEPIERAARALHELYTKEKQRSGARDMPTWEELGEDGRFYFTHRVSSVLRAIREPSEFQLECGAYQLPGIDTVAKQYKARDVYRIMVDALLVEADHE